MTVNEIREKFIKYFEGKGHTHMPSSSLVPENISDSSVLFTTAGMQPLVPYLLGEKHPKGQRLVNVQKCLRTADIESIGNETHHTFFEMLGNWSIGDPESEDGIGEKGYWKKESIEMSFDFLTSKEWLGLDKNRLATSVFIGDEDAPFDEESYEVWKNLGMSGERIAKLTKKDNWWGQVLGPCGPNTEIFYWVGSEKAPEKFDPKNETWVEIWNNVFMEYDRKVGEKDKDGNPVTYYYDKLNQKNVDTGMGLERITSVINGLDDNYESDLFKEIVGRIEEISGTKYEKNKKAFRIIADHTRAITFSIAEGVTPSNLDKGYVVRRLLRRAVRYGRELNIEKIFIRDIATAVIELMGEQYPELKRDEQGICTEIDKEEEKFNKTLTKGLIEAKNAIDEELSSRAKQITGKKAFDLYQTYGFPLEMIIEEAEKEGVSVDLKGFEYEVKKHQDLSRKGSEKKFKGGLESDNDPKVTQYHTVAHLLLAALREVLGDHVHQKGANITSERLRFDFSQPEKMTDEEKQKVTDWINDKLGQDLEVRLDETDPKTAKEHGAEGEFSSKYGDKVKVYTIGGDLNSDQFVSKEICGGPHVSNLSEIEGKLRIKKEESSSAGVRRIKALLE